MGDEDAFFHRVVNLISPSPGETHAKEPEKKIANQLRGGEAGPNLSNERDTKDAADRYVGIRGGCAEMPSGDIDHMAQCGESLNEETDGDWRPTFLEKGLRSDDQNPHVFMIVLERADVECKRLMDIGAVS